VTENHNEIVVGGADGDLRLQVFKYLFLVSLCKIKRHRVTPFERQTASRERIDGMLHELGLKRLGIRRGRATAH